MLKKASSWIKNNNINGMAIPISHISQTPYPEVTGYFIPTLLSLGEIKLAEGCARWLTTVQHQNGSFYLNNPAISYVFDTGQVIRGWVSIIDRMPELLQPLKRACDWIIATADNATGRFMCPQAHGDWSLGERGEVNEAIHLYTIKPMQDAAKILNLPYIQAAADRACHYYLKHSSLTNFTQNNSLTHFYGYIQEALCELGYEEKACEGMAAVGNFQQENGAIPAYHNVHWICSTGLAQLIKVWYLLGDKSHADLAIQFLRQIQNASGGFYGSYGIRANYFPQAEISWAVKYAIEAEQLFIANHFNETAHLYAPTISQNDGRFQAVFKQLTNAQNVLDAGCGKGRYAALIKQIFPQMVVHGVDVSDEMLRHVPENIIKKNASLQNLPYPEKNFDVVYCVEALEHALQPEAAIHEMLRVLKPGGRLIIIDKNIDRLGALQIESWENWFDLEKITQILQKENLQVSAEFISYDNKPADGLFISWVATKNL